MTSLAASLHLGSVSAAWMQNDPACTDLWDIFDAAHRDGPPTATDPKLTADEHLAVTICRRCPVRPDCLEWADDTEEIAHGVLGGLTSWQRARIRKGRA